MESFSEACENAQIRFRPAGFAPLHPLPGLCPGPTGGLSGPLDPRPNLLFSKMTLLFHFIMKTLAMVIWSSVPQHGKSPNFDRSTPYWSQVDSM